FAAEPICETRPVRQMLQQRLAVIRERQRDQSSSCQPTRHTAQNNRVLKRLTWRGVGQSKRFIAVGARQSFQPPSRMKGRRRLVTGEQIVPAGIRERIYDVEIHSCRPSHRTTLSPNYVSDMFG